MLKMRLGAVPLIEVNMPNPLLTKYRSSQYGQDRVVVGGPWQASLVKAVSVVVNCALPLDDRLIDVECLVVQRVREGNAMVVTCIIPVIADVRRARHDTAADLRYV